MMKVMRVRVVRMMKVVRIRVVRVGGASEDETAQGGHGKAW